MQLLHSQVYELKVPKLIKFMLTDVGIIRRNVNKMLLNEPEGVSDETVLMWSHLKPFSVELFQKYSKMVMFDEPLIDIVNNEFTVFKDSLGFQCHGMRSKNTGMAMGITRWT